MPYISVSALSHEGLVREHNEDSLVVGPWTLCGTVTENPQTLLFPFGTPCVVAVADGLGGHPGGEIASALVARRLALVGPGLDSEAAVRDALDACNRAVYAVAAGDPELTAMGTTVAGVVLMPETVLVFNVGDSRVYDASGDGLRRLSVDDSPPPAPGHRTTSIVTQTLGGSVHPTTIEAHVTGSAPATGARYLVCSDGLTDPVPDEALEDVLSEHTDGRAAFELWKAAIEAGGPDNITLALVRIGAQ
ncbi:PP2C family protein-serine/threonine phosphatase [Kitasatospora atroaurantiaca]|uniref:Serine/threonine protein phosphatase PrpC n=1 Tax=Kitasatospora atroaurantiaca TaxID=285545 RepID=A0A561EI81_9ACTN|nr:protein phosphatase 2C domain-containing protein [Kitasatospora atroaurantiaca]TWE15327.1 serine/threonine protein phosphatase PrpC [Kitasatospora atroaurantiaca]